MNAGHDQKIQRFVQHLVKNQTYATVTDDKVAYNDPEIHKLFQYLIDHRVGILPYFADDQDFWMIVGDNQTSLDAFMRTVSRFLVPSYATFSGGVPFKHQFDPRSELGDLGREIFVGYYRLLSRTEDREHILMRLGECLQVINAAAPGQQLDLDRQSYRHLLDAFQRALTAHQWEAAERLLNVISSGHHTSTENVAFLRIAWLARQSRWQDIWDHPYYAQLAALPAPGAIRASMLTAFHHVHLCKGEREEDWSGILDLLEQHRPLLAMLLMGRFGLAQPAVLRVYAYVALLDDDWDALERVESDIPKDDYQTRFIVRTLLQRRPADGAPPDLSMEEQLQAALNKGDYDTAWHVSERLPDPMRKLAARIQIAYLSQEILLATEVLDQHERFYIENRRLLYSTYPGTEAWLKSLQQHVNRDEVSAIRSWPDWFAFAKNNGVVSDLLPMLDQLRSETTPASWLPQQFAELAEKLADVSNEEYKHETAYRRAIELLTQLCINAEDFPRQQSEAADVYELLLQFITQDARSKTNANLLLRLQEAVLINDLAAAHEAATRMMAWFEKPVPAMQEYVLEALELLAQYSESNAQLYQWFRQWAEEMARSPVVETSSLSVWLTFARWMQADDALIAALEEKLSNERQEHIDHLALLPDRTQITIFTFDEAAAKRAEYILLDRNPNLDVRICSEHVNNDRVQSLAARSDYVVLVTTCISHAISYTVMPLAGDRVVLPRSRGASSILQALEEKVSQARQLNH